MKSRSEIWESVAQDVAALCSVQTSRDVKQVTCRVAAEGEAFFTATLPKFAKDLERSLEAKWVDTDDFVGFHRRTRYITVNGEQKKLRHGTPVFLGDLMQKLFDDSYEVSQEQYSEMVALCERFDLSIHERFPPRLREPADQGELREMAEAIMAIRQLCLMFGKEKELCSDSDVERAIQEYKLCDEELMLPFKTVE